MKEDNLKDRALREYNQMNKDFEVINALNQNLVFKWSSS